MSGVKGVPLRSSLGDTGAPPDGAPTDSQVIYAWRSRERDHAVMLRPRRR